MRASYPILLALISAALFGAATPASKLLLQELPPFQLAGLLYLGAALGIMPAARWSGTAWPTWQANRASVFRLAGAIGFGGVLAPIFLLFGLRLARAGSVSLWLSLELVATAVLGHVFFRDRLGRWGWVGVAGTVLASVLLSRAEGSVGIEAGALIALACACWGMDNQLTALIDGMSPAYSTFYKGLVAGLVNLAIGIVAQPYAGSLRASGLALGLGAISYGVSIALYIAAAQSLGATRSQMIFASAPFFGVSLSALILRESVSPAQLLAAAALAAAVACLFRDRHAHAHEHGAMAHTHLHRHDDGHHEHVHPQQLPSLQHAHWHEHAPAKHAHPHWPDLHHRHVHR